MSPSLNDPYILKPLQVIFAVTYSYLPVMAVIELTSFSSDHVPLTESYTLSVIFDGLSGPSETD